MPSSPNARRETLLVVCMLGAAGCIEAPGTRVAAGSPEDLSVGAAYSELVVCPGGPTVDGVDVSRWDGTIDWTAVAASGKVFAFMKATQDTAWVDSEFSTNWSRSERAGLVRGAFHFFCPAVDGTAQADHFLATVGTIAPGDLPPTLDVEVCADSVCGTRCGWDGVSCATIETNLHRWVDRVASVTGRTPIIYTSAGSWHAVCDSTAFSAVSLWVANWGASCPSLPSAWSEWAFWQNSATGTVPGISSATDVDVFNGDLAALLAFVGGSTTMCGDGSCGPGENCSTCSTDCGSCPADGGVDTGVADAGATDAGTADAGADVAVGPCLPIGSMGGIVDELGPCWTPSGPSTRWDPESPEGYLNHLYWVSPVPGPAAQNSAAWNLDFVEAGTYRVEAYTDGRFATRTIQSAVYRVEHEGTSDRVVVNQRAVDGWNPVGTFHFASGGGQSVRLDDLPAYTGDGDIVLFDAVRLTRVADATSDGGDSAAIPPGGYLDGGCSCSVPSARRPAFPALASVFAMAPVLAMAVRRRRNRRSLVGLLRSWYRFSDGAARPEAANRALRARRATRSGGNG